MDNKDKKILELLKQDARMTYTDISKEIDMSVPSVIDRIKKLNDQGIIKNSTVELDYESMGRSLQAIICVDIETDQYENFLEFAEEEASVVDFYRVVGPFNAIIKVALKNTYQLEKLVDEIKKYGSTLTCVITTAYFKDQIPIETV